MNSPIPLLLIEDNPGDARLIRDMLLGSRDGEFTLNVAGSLREALKQVKEATYEVILLDLSLPDSMGIESLLKARAGFPDAAIIVLTGLDDQRVGVQAVQMGAQDYLVKDDVEANLLRRAIRYAIERHRIEAALRRSEEAYRSLIDDVFDTSMVAAIILDRNFTVVWCNAATEVYFGLGRDLTLGQDIRQLVNDHLKSIFADPDDYAERLLAAYARQDFTDRFECHVLPGPKRDERWLEHWSQPIRTGIYAQGRIEHYTDITDRKRLQIAQGEQRRVEQALYENRVELAAAEERQRLARELHDAVSQTLFTCSALAESAVRRWEKQPQRAHELMTEVHRLTLTALSEMRILLLELRPESLLKVSLKQLFEQYLKPIQKRRGFELIMEIDDGPPLPPDIQIAFYRITQETLNNIDKHAKATVVRVTVHDYPDRLELTIRDNGAGFDVDQVPPTSLGLGIMRERAEAINATLHIESQIGQGTQMTLVWMKQRELTDERY